MEEIETGSVDTESGGTEGASSDASSESTENSGAPAQAAASEPKQTEIDWAKAFEHPRFKGLVADKNNYQKQYQDMQSQYKTLQQELGSLRNSQPKAPSETDLLLKDLEKVDPRLANVIKSQLEAAETAKSVQARLEQFEKQSHESARQQTLATAVGKINSLHEVNKTSDFGKRFINSQLDIAYRNGELDASDLKAVESAYKEASEFIKKAFEDAKREVTKGYVQSKTQDSSVPASVPKGAQARPAQKTLDVPRDKEAMRAAVVKSYMKEQAASRDASNS